MERFLEDNGLFKRLYVLDSKGQIKISAQLEEILLHAHGLRFTNLNVSQKVIENDLNLFMNWREDNNLNFNVTNIHLIGKIIASNINYLIKS